MPVGIKVENFLVVIFDEIFEQLKKFMKNPILIGISSNFLHNISKGYTPRWRYLWHLSYRGL